MSFLTAILLGILQGLTEFIPVSSSGHLVLVQHFFNVGESSDILFELFMHLGTLVAVVVYFRSTLLDMFKSLFSWRFALTSEGHRKNRNLMMYLFISSLVTGMFYYFMGDFLKSIYQAPLIVAILLLFTGIVIFISDYVRDNGIPASNMGLIRSVFIGLAQGIAILPGISRSGATISVGLWTGIKRKEAAEFSFLLSIPAILAANLSELKAFSALEADLLHSYLAGFVSSFIVGYFVIAFLIQLIENSHLKYFAFYCWFIGILSIVLISMGL